MSALKSQTFASKFDDQLDVPKLYRGSVQTLECQATSSISLAQLEVKLSSGGDAMKSMRFGSQVAEKLKHIKRIAQQLEENTADYPPLHFAPGALAEELNALIATKEGQLALTKNSHMNRSNVRLCHHFLHGQCANGVTCTDSHTLQSLTTHMEQWMNNQIQHSGASTLSVEEVFGKEAWEVLASVAKQHEFSSMVFRTLDRNGIQILSAALNEDAFETVTSMDLSKNNICEVFPRGVLKLAKAIGNCTHLQDLSLGYNALGVSGSLAIGRAIAQKSLITSLNLSGNAIHGTDPAFSYLCQALASNFVLQRLSLAHNPLGPDGIRKLLGALSEVDSPLEFLDLFSTSMGDAGCLVLAEFIKKEAVGQQLRYLNISWNRLSFESVGPLASALESNKVLEVFRCYYNHGVGRKGAIALADYIKQSTSLTTVDLRWNSLTDDGAATIGEALASNTSVKELQLFGNDLDPRTESAISEKMKGRKRASITVSDDAESAPVTRSDEVW